MDQSDSVYTLWERIETHLRLRAPDAWVQLASGASDQEIKQLEDLLGVALPQDFLTSYRLHDGCYTMKLVTLMDVLPLKRIAAEWQILDELLHDEEWAAQPPYYFTEEVVRDGWSAGPIRPVWWDHRWIPFGSDSAGNLTCLDLAPAPGGTVGQIIDWDHECGPSRLLFPSFGQLLSAMADQVEKIDEVQPR